MCVFPGGLSSCTDSSIILQCLFFMGLSEWTSECSALQRHRVILATGSPLWHQQLRRRVSSLPSRVRFGRVTSETVTFNSINELAFCHQCFGVWGLQFQVSGFVGLGVLC